MNTIRVALKLLTIAKHLVEDLKKTLFHMSTIKSDNIQIQILQQTQTSVKSACRYSQPIETKMTSMEVLRTRRGKASVGRQARAMIVSTLY